MVGLWRLAAAALLLGLSVPLPAAEATWCHDPYPGQCASPNGVPRNPVCMGKDCQHFKVQSFEFEGIAAQVSLRFANPYPMQGAAAQEYHFVNPGSPGVLHVELRQVAGAAPEGAKPPRVLLVLPERDPTGMRISPGPSQIHGAPYDRLSAVAPSSAAVIDVPFQLTGSAAYGSSLPYGLVYEPDFSNATQRGVQGELPFFVVPRTESSWSKEWRVADVVILVAVVALAGTVLWATAMKKS